MKMLRNAAFITFVAGLGLLTAGLVAACSGGNEDEPEASPTSFDNRQTATPEATEETSTPTARVTSSPTVAPTATPTPYVGDVARLKIPRFGVDSVVEPVGVDANNQMETPVNPRNTGFYDPRLTGWGGNEFFPGWNGNAVFSAHVNYFPDIVGPFADLAKIEPGDKIIVVMANGQEYTYEAVFKDRYDVNTIPMGDLIWNQARPAEEQWVTLITCGGEFVQTSSSGAGEYIHRDVVIARRVATPAAGG